MLHRASGTLLHTTSLPSRFGIGDLGPEAYGFIDFLAESGQKLWQVLPLGPTACGNSPYMCYSAMAGNPLQISPEELRHKGLLSKDDLAGAPEFPAETVDFERVTAGWLCKLSAAEQEAVRSCRGCMASQEIHWNQQRSGSEGASSRR